KGRFLAPARAMRILSDMLLLCDWFAACSTKLIPSWPGLSGPSTNFFRPTAKSWMARLRGPCRMGESGGPTSSSSKSAAARQQRADAVTHQALLAEFVHLFHRRRHVLILLQEAVDLGNCL